MNLSTLKQYQKFCLHCNCLHQLQENSETRRKAEEVMGKFEKFHSIDIFSPQPNKHFSTKSLFSEARGKMFGVLQTRNKEGGKQFHYAFSGQYQTVWLVPGWVPPLFDIIEFDRLNEKTERKIKNMTRRLAALNAPRHAKEQQALKNKRKRMSQSLMKDIHKLYKVYNFKGESKPLTEIFINKGIPSGTGDCCAPKLLNHAAKKKLIPIALSEFYWGKTNKSGNRKHKEFYPPCPEKCHTILDFQLCGVPQDDI